MVIKNKTTSNAVIYTRVSSERQVENMSLGEQKKLCLDYCARRDFTVLKHFEERGESAKSAQRTELQKMLEYCSANKNNIYCIVVYKIDRFSRNVGDYMALKAFLSKLDIKLESVSEPIDDSNIGRLMETILSGFAQFDNDVRGERARIGMKARAEEGAWTCSPPTGYINIRDEYKRPTLQIREEM